MKYTTDEALAEVLRRSDQLVRRRDRRTCGRLFGLTGALLAALVLVIAVLPGGGGSAPAESVYGAFLLSREAGGYVLAAVLAFALGVVITLLCLKQRQKNRDNPHLDIHNEEDVP